jgi:hypothetical protein
MWFDVFPVADTPWQVEHLPAAFAWSMLAPNQVLVEWQSSHCPVVLTWFEGLPVAVTPWQEEHEPVTLLWSMRTEVKVEVDL